MKTNKSLGYASAGTLALALLAGSSLSIAETGQSASNNGANSHSLVHKVSHSLADTQNYTSSGTSGYKWGRKSEQDNANAEWASTTPARSGYKWGNSSTAEPAAQSYAGSASYEWGVKSYADQTGYKWGLKN